jgi:hypothetical protein
MPMYVYTHVLELPDQAMADQIVSDASDFFGAYATAANPAVHDFCGGIALVNPTNYWHTT